MNRKWVLGAFVVAIAAVAGFLVQRLIADQAAISAQSPSEAAKSAAVGREAAAATADVRNQAGTDGSGGATGDNEPPARRIPETIPAIELPDRDGVSRPLTSWKGRPVLINFWATWCGPCREEIPLLKTLRNERTRERLEVVGIAIDQREAVLRYARDIGIDYPILIGEKEGYAAAEAFGVSLVLPFSVFADSKGRVITLKIGELHADEAEFILDRVRDVDSKRLAVDIARQQIADRMRELAIKHAQQAADAH
jgi:thiol-disulfide isomerase/thioredoxin